MKTRGTPEQRAEQRRQQRVANRVRFVRDRARRAAGGHQRVVVACNAALAASRRITDEARSILARQVAEAVERADTPSNWKERP